MTTASTPRARGLLSRLYLTAAAAATALPLLLLGAPASVSAQQLPLSLVAVLHATSSGGSASGLLTFSQSADFASVHIAINATGLKPQTQYAVHFHTFGDISDPTGANVFGHFNPTNKTHGCQTATGDLTAIHVGDMGNVTTDANGAVLTAFDRPSPISQSATLQMNSLSNIVGRGVALHQNPDDCVTQPTGNSGGKIAQGVLGWQSDTTFPLPNTFPEFPIDDSIVDKEAIALLQSVNSSGVTGLAFFRQHDPSDIVRIRLEIDGLAPNSIHGVHVHTFGDTTDTVAGATVGLHFNPFNRNHSCFSVGHSDRHVGDLGNIRAGDDGRVRVTLASELLTLFLGEESFALGRALVIHADPDDCHTQPTGASGKKLAMGVLGLRNSTLPIPTFESVFGATAPAASSTSASSSVSSSTAKSGSATRVAVPKGLWSY